MATAHSGLISLRGNLMAAVDFETTGGRVGYHEIIQVAVQPLDSELRPIYRPFYADVSPKFPERADNEASRVHGLNLYDLQQNAPHAEKVADMLVEWWERLDLGFGKRLVPLAHNWAFEAGFMSDWLGETCKNLMFHVHPRDSMLYAIAVNDRACFMGENPPFNSVSLGSLCANLGVINENPHDALADARAEAELYYKLLRFEI